LLNSDLIQVEQYDSASALLAATERRRKRERARATPKRPAPVSVERLLIQIEAATAEEIYNEAVGPTRPPKWKWGNKSFEVGQLQEERRRREHMGQDYTPSLARIERLVCNRLRIPQAQFHADIRYNHLVMARALFVKMARKYCKGNECYHKSSKFKPKSYPEIGRHLGGRDHSTIIHLDKTFDRIAARYRELRDKRVAKRNRKRLGQ
jgi:hypothetical protein